MKKGIDSIIKDIRYDLRDYKLLITSPLNRDVGVVPNKFKGGNQLLCDVAFKINDGKIESIKNRYEKY